MGGLRAYSETYHAEWVPLLNQEVMEWPEEALVGTASAIVTAYFFPCRRFSRKKSVNMEAQSVAMTPPTTVAR